LRRTCWRSGVTLVSWDQEFSTDLGAGPQAARKAEQKRRGHRLEHDPEKWEPVFPRDKREAFARKIMLKQKDRAG